MYCGRAFRTLSALSALVVHANALIRFPCSQLVTERFDPLVTPGQVSPHVHQIVGGNAFNLTMDQSLDIPNVATCTTCRPVADKSNYWTAVLYFKHPTNGSFIRVPQMANHFTGEPDGGITVYYIQPPGSTTVKAFPPGFRMITGNPMIRRPIYGDRSPDAWALTFRCWETGGAFDPDNLPNAAPGSPVDTFGLPQRKCPAGIRSNIFFPSCWDGVNLDTPDHRSHMSFLMGDEVGPDGVYYMVGECPPTHPVRLPVLFYEVVWDTRAFNSMWDPTNGDEQPFVLSSGDPTGYGHHGDYIFGWEGDSLQRAMDNCHYMGPDITRCPDLEIQTDEEMNKCKLPVMVDEKVEGEYLRELPGCNPLQYGPEPATLVRGCTAVSTTSLPAATPNAAGQMVVAEAEVTPPPAA